MIKTIKNIFKQDNDGFKVPHNVQEAIPIDTIWKDGIFKVGKNKYSMTLKFTDINYAVASREDKESMFLKYSDLLNSFDVEAITKITIALRKMNRKKFESEILLPLKDDDLDVYRQEYNDMLLSKASATNNMLREIYITISTFKSSYDEARTYFRRMQSEIVSHLSKLGSKCVVLDSYEKLRIIHDFYRVGEEENYNLDLDDLIKKEKIRTLLLNRRMYRFCLQGASPVTDWRKRAVWRAVILSIRQYLILQNILRNRSRWNPWQKIWG